MSLEIARTTARSSVAPQRFVDRWCELDTHAEWSTCMEYLRLDEPFAVGARGTLKSKSGDPAPFVVTEVVPGSVYADATLLDGAALTVRHEALPDGDGSHLTLTATLEGPDAQRWAAELGDGVQRDLEADLAALIALLEGSGVDRRLS